MSHRQPVPQLDLMPMLGLTALLITMVPFLGQVEAIAVIATHIPGL